MNSFANGDWLDRARIRRIAWIVAAIGVLAIMALFATGTGTLDFMGRPLGTDFSNVWTAGRMALEGRAAEAWDWNAQFAVQHTLHGNGLTEYYGWHYPPPFLLIAAAVAALPYLPALIGWQAATLAPFAWLMTRIARDRDTLLLTLAAPVTLVCVTHGHNGFLTALLLGGGLWLLDRRPFLAGLLLGCLIYKPQFGLVIPVLLLAARNWRAFAGATISAMILIGTTLAIWGWPVWQAFLDSLPLTREVVIEQGRTGWYKIMSPFAAVRMWGGGITAAYGLQGVVTLAAVSAVAWAGWTNVRPAIRNALVCAAVLVSTPYVLDYDFVVLLPAIAFLANDLRDNGVLRWEKNLLALGWAAPLVARQLAELIYLPLGLLSVFGIAFVALRRGIKASPSRR